MNAIIQLDSDWECATVQADGSHSDAVLTRLRDWRFAVQESGATLVCRRVFELEPLDYCARYHLHFSGESAHVSVTLRGEVLAESRGPLVTDVTDYVSLDDNLLELRVDLASVKTGDRLGAVWLEAVPCED